MAGNGTTLTACSFGITISRGTWFWHLHYNVCISFYWRYQFCHFPDTSAKTTCFQFSDEHWKRIKMVESCAWSQALRCFLCHRDTQTVFGVAVAGWERTVASGVVDGTGLHAVHHLHLRQLGLVSLPGSSRVFRRRFAAFALYLIMWWCTKTRSHGKTHATMNFCSVCSSYGLGALRRFQTALLHHQNASRAVDQ